MIGLEALLSPRSIALVGAVSDVHRYNGRPLRFLQAGNYAGRIYPVNPRYHEIAGTQCYPSISEVEEVIDLAIVMVGGSRTISVLEECVRAGAKAALVMASGFGELGATGKSVEQTMRALSEASGMRIVGPNSAGMMNPPLGALATLLTAAEVTPPSPGPIGLVAQSGTACSIPIALARARGLGFRYVVSTGNEADVHLTELIEAFVADDGVEVILAYVEQLRNGGQFVEVADWARRAGKPIVALRAGASEAGKRVVRSHTGALAGNDEYYDAIFREAGVIRVHDLHELVDVATAIVRGGRPTRPNVFVLSVGSGGAAAIAADLAERNGLEMGEPSPALRARLETHVSEFVSVGNPLDAAGVSGLPDDEPQMMEQCLKEVVESVEYGIVIVVVPLLPYSKDLAAILATTERLNGTPILTAWLGGPTLEEARQVAANAGYPAYDTISAAMRAAKALIEWNDGCRRGPRTRQATGDSPRAKNASRLLRSAGGDLSEVDCKAVLQLYGIAIPREKFVMSDDAACEVAKEIGFPVAIKAVGRHLYHKSSVGAVQLGIANEVGVRRALESIRSAVATRARKGQIEGFLVSPMVHGGCELIVGAVRDEDLGTILMVGAGGVIAEAVGDVVFAVPPVDGARARGLLRELRMGRILEGYGGAPAYDLDAAATAVEGISTFVLDLSEVIEEVEVNPLVVLPEGAGALALDALIRLRKEQDSE